MLLCLLLTLFSLCVYVYCGYNGYYSYNGYFCCYGYNGHYGYYGYAASIKLKL
jgi:hypothetical protein